jgi:hypothetical protein
VIRLSPQDVARFKEIHRRHTGEDLTDEEAREYAERVIRLVAFAAGIELFPLPPD